MNILEYSIIIFYNQEIFLCISIEKDRFSLEFRVCKRERSTLFFNLFVLFDAFTILLSALLQQH